jgi:hypothetical protein
LKKNAVATDFWLSTAGSSWAITADLQPEGGMTTFFEVIADIRGVWAGLRGQLLVNTCSERLLAELDQLRENNADLIEKNKRLRAENTALRTLNLELRAVSFMSVNRG